MASFTDIIPQFNPYVQQLPVEAMVSVGMEKQRRYDEGLQKIQGQIEQVAGLDIYRDVDKQYLTSKMNELGSNLKGFAASDFSNFQLVNSVGGMVNQLSKDSIVKNAVQSTAKLRKELSLMDEYRKSGKSDKNNEMFFLDKAVNPYLNGGITDANGNPISFNGSFSPYVDIQEEFRKSIKEAGIDEKTVQQMYQTDNSGKVLIDPKTKQPIPARTMTEVETSSNLRQVKAVIENVLKRGDIQNQLTIDGWANTRSVPASSILETYTETFNKKVDDIDAEILELNTILTGTMTPEERKVQTEKLGEFKALRGKYESQYKSTIGLAQSDPESFKIQYYKNNFENNLVDGFVKYESKIKNIASPLTQQLNWEADYAFKEKKEAFDQRMTSANLNIAQSRLKIDQLKFEADYEFDPRTGKYSKKPEVPAPSEYLRLTADVPGEENRSASQRQEAQLRGIQQSNGATGMDLMYNYLYKVNNGRNKNGTPFTKADAVKSVESFAKTNNESTDTFLTRWILNLDNKAKEAGIKLSSSDVQLVENYKRNHDNYTTLIAVGKLADDEAYKATGLDVREYTKSLTPINVKLANGKSTTVSKEDILDYMLLIKNDDSGAESRIVAKYGSLKDFPLNTANAPGISAAERENRMALQKASGMFSIYTKDWNKFKEASKIKNDYLAKVVNTDDVFSFGDADEKVVKMGKNKLSTFISNASSLTGLNFDKSKALTALTDANSKVSYKASAPFEEGGQWKGTATITTDKGEIIEVDLPVQSDFEQLTGKKFNAYKMNPLKIKASVSRFGSTNLGAYTTDPAAWQTAAVDSKNFIQLKDSKKYIPLGADLNVLPNGGYTLTAYFKDRTTGKILNPIEFDRIYMDETSPIADLAFLNESMIDNKLK